MGTFRRVMILVVLGSLILVTPAFSRESTGSSLDSRLTQESPESPLLIIENEGQFQPEALFLLYGRSTRIWVTQNALWIIQIQQPSPPTIIKEPEIGRRRAALAPQYGVPIRLSFTGANLSPVIEPDFRQATRFSYFTGNDPSKWYADVPVWGSLR
ncbi:MAG: hypothetical protein H6Q38_2039, partial [Chloroflexi bacterium]|nr:hypothetical protein [Chloroflexota bacterium]